jgi:hypothetical protein
MLQFPCVDFEFLITCGLLHVEAGLILSYRIKKALDFWVPIVLSRWFPERAHQMFSEMPVRI